MRSSFEGGRTGPIAEDGEGVWVSRALTLAPAAQSWLRNAASARVLHVFGRACDLISAEGEVISLVMPEIGAQPFALVVSPPVAPDGQAADFPELFAAGDGATLREGRLEVGRFALDTRGANVWQPRPAWGQLRGQPEHLKARLPALRQLLARSAPPSSFAELAQESAPGPAGETFQAQALRAARGPAQSVCTGLAAGDAKTVRAGAGALAGLGGGLTPSGDDFLAGVLYALWAVRPPEQFAALAEAIVASAAPRTSRLSAAWLEAAARGEAGQPWHALAEALASPDRAALEAAVRGITSVGHTSGADALAGFVCALSRLYGK